MKNILVTGNLGYIGTALTKMLIQLKYNVVGFDSDLYRYCSANDDLKNLRQIENFRQVKKDIRDISLKDLEGIDSIIHLAALSNDPLGELNSDLTHEINYTATIQLAKMAKLAGVHRLVFASTQSIYGISDKNRPLAENDQIRPITCYAKSKWKAEIELKDLSANDFVTTSLRPATVFGPSPRIRCDVLLNNLVGYAFTTGKIEIKSDGRPWRPIIHVNDVCRAFLACIIAPKSLINGESFNVGVPNGNYTVAQLAEIVNRLVPNTEIIFTHTHIDSRTYQVNFDKISNMLSDYYQPGMDVMRGVNELLDFYSNIELDYKDFEGKKFIRIKQLDFLLNSGQLRPSLRWN